MTALKRFHPGQSCSPHRTPTGERARASTSPPRVTSIAASTQVATIRRMAPPTRLSASSLSFSLNRRRRPTIWRRRFEQPYNNWRKRARQWRAMSKAPRRSLDGYGNSTRADWLQNKRLRKPTSSCTFTSLNSPTLNVNLRRQRKPSTFWQSRRKKRRSRPHAHGRERGRFINSRWLRAPVLLYELQLIQE